MNRFGISRRLLEKRASLEVPCVFISHQRSDKLVARLVSEFLRQMELDVYFDADDAALQGAWAFGDEHGIVEAIDDGIASCTHLLGIISVNTRRSWWVPYEIGACRTRGRPCAHLILGTVARMPEYIRIEPCLYSMSDLKGWAQDLGGQITEGFSKQASESILPSFLPVRRSANDVESEPGHVR